MGKYIIISLLLLFLIFPIQASEKSEIWMKIYQRSNNLVSKIKVMRNFEETANRDFIPLITDILSEISDKQEPKNFIEKNRHEELTLLAIKIAYKIKARQATDHLYKILNQSKNPLIIAYSLMAIGAGGDKKYNEVFYEMLVNKNARLMHGDKPEEYVVYGLLDAIGNLKHEKSFIPVFYTRYLGYSKRIQKKAGLTLDRIQVDPAEKCLQIIIEAIDIYYKERAYEYVMNADLDNEKKIQVARATLDYAVKSKFTTDVVLLNKMKNMRNLATQHLGELKAGDEAIVDLLADKFKMDRDLESQLIVISALEKINSKKSAGLLVSYLNDYNKRAEAGMGQGKGIEGNRILRAIILAIGNIGSVVAYEELMVTSSLTDIYSYEIIKMANDSLKKLK